eukprot:1154358-Pelagomonas_calceolata.AAC.16
MACLVEGMGSIYTPTHTQEDCVKSGLGCHTRERPREYVRLRPSALGEGTGVAAQSVLPGWSCAAPYLFITSHTAVYPM